MAKAKYKITKVKGGFQIDVLDSHGKRTRPKFDTKAEAKAEFDRITAQKSSGEFLADASKVTFNKALDLFLERNLREGLALASRRRVESVVKAHLRPIFGTRKLRDFRSQRMKFVQDWLDHRSRDHGVASMTLAHTLSYIKQSLDEAIKAGLLGSPNPVTEFNVRVPQFVKREEREVLTLDEISKLISVASRRDHAEHEAAFRVRFLLVLFGLLLGLRDQECGAVCWDCVNLEDRLIHIRRKIENGGLVNSTKTGKSGYRSIPMPPILGAALSSYRDLLQSQGHPTDGAVPVLRPGRADLVTQGAVGDHWDRLAKKAGFLDETWAKDHTFYVLRHTGFNLLRSVGMELDDLADLMGHTTIITANKHYRHRTPHFDIIRREVHALGLEHTPAGFIDGLSFVLARRWRAEGMNIGCTEPRSVTPVLDHDTMKLLPGPNTIDVLPTIVANEATGTPLPGVNSLETLRAYQMKRCHELHALNWTKGRIADELGLCTTTISDWVRTAHNARWMRKAGRAERAEMSRRAAELRDQFGWSSTKIAKELGVKPHRVVVWERKRGKPMPHQPGDHKLGKYHARIVQMLADGKSTTEIGAAIGHSHSAVAYYINRHKLRDAKPKRRTSGVNIDLYEDRIREKIAAGKSDGQIARELDEVSRSGIAGFIARKGLRKQAENNSDGSKRP